MPVKATNHSLDFLYHNAQNLSVYCAEMMFNDNSLPEVTNLDIKLHARTLRRISQIDTFQLLSVSTFLGRMTPLIMYPLPSISFQCAEDYSALSTEIYQVHRMFFARLHVNPANSCHRG